ncbi:MAG: glycosyltransferase family 4 protein [Verrucomicrobiota bacterium]|nr:glycosyltransferase family 4 protein [Verrucomicrobiota bacterium]
MQSILKRHHSREQDSHFLFSFEANNFKEPNISGLGVDGWDSIRCIRKKLAKHSDLFPDSVAVCHNMWGLQFLTELIPAKRRIGILHSDWTTLRPFLQSQKELLDGVLCVSNTLMELVAECLPELSKDNRIQLIPYPIDGVPIMPNRMSLVKRPVIIGWIGRMQEEQKRVDRLPSLLKAFDDAQIDYRFELLGDGPMQEWLEKQLPADRTVFHGRKSGDDYYSTLSKWDFITSVSDYEGLPISMLEALSAGVLPLYPTIGSGGDEYAEKLSSNFVWEAFQFEQAASKLNLLLKQPEATLHQSRLKAVNLTARHSESEYFRIFDSFTKQIVDLPRISNAELPNRPFYFSDQLPFGLMTRIWPNGCFRRND